MTRSTLIISNVEFFARDGPHLCSRPIVSDIVVRFERYDTKLCELFLPLSWLWQVKQCIRYSPFRPVWNNEKFFNSKYVHTFKVYKRPKCSTRSKKIPDNFELTTIGYGGRRPSVSKMVISFPPSCMNFLEYRRVVESTAAQSACLDSTICADAQCEPDSGEETTWLITYVMMMKWWHTGLMNFKHTCK